MLKPRPHYSLEGRPARQRIFATLTRILLLKCELLLLLLLLLLELGEERRREGGEGVKE